MNRVELIGNLARDPEFRLIGQNSTPKTTFTMAVSRKYKDKEETAWIPVVVWGKSAEFCRDYLCKGIKISVVGKLETGSYEKDTGEKVYTWNVVPDYGGGIQILTPKDQKNVRQLTVEVVDGQAVNAEGVPF